MKTKLVCPDANPRVLPPVHPNVGLTVLYEKKLDHLIRAMHHDVVYWLTIRYWQNKPRLAQDSPASVLVNEMRTLGRRWMKQFDDAARELGRWFATTAFQRSDTALRMTLANQGWSVKFTNTPVVQDVLTATIAQQVNLIRSIAQEHLADIQGAVLRSVQQGGDLATLTNELHAKYLPQARKKAILIARSQNALATASITRVRQKELGIEKCIWRHSRGGKKPRPSHVANDGKLYNVSEGWFDPEVQQNVFPGQLLNCRCVSLAIIPGLNS